MSEMTERANSSGTLLDGMAGVAFGDISQLNVRENRKRELQQLIQVIWTTIGIGFLLSASYFFLGVMKTRNVYYGAVPNPYSGEQRPDGSFEAKIEQCPEQRCTKASCSWCLLVYNNPGIFSVFWFYSAWVSGPCEVWRFHDFKKCRGLIAS